MQTFDFEDGLFPASWKNADIEGWQPSTETSDGGTFSLASNSTITNRQISSAYMMFDFEGGDFDCRYRISSEGNFDFGYIVLDGVAIVNQASGAGSWTSMPTQVLSAGVHLIQFNFIKDNSSASGFDAFFVDNVTVPNFTEIKNDVDFIDLLNTIFANDISNPWVNASSTDRNAPFIGAVSSTVGTADRSLTYTSPSDSPAGNMFFVGFANNSGETLKLFIDSVEVFSDTGTFYTGNSGNLRAPLGHHQAVTAGSHDYEIRATDSAQARAFIFYEPSLTAAAVTSAITGTATATIDEDDITTGGKTIIITLTGDTWVTAGATFNAQRQAIINGLDAASSPTNGWNNEVRDNEVVTAVVRTSDTVVTITLTAQAGYDISSQEVITVTIPSTALVTSTGDITGSPTFTVDPVVAGGSLLLFNRSIANYQGIRQ